MARDIETKLTVRGVDKLSGPLKKMGGAAGKFGDKARKDLGRVQDLRGPIKMIEDYRNAEKRLGKASTKLEEAKKRVKDVGGAFKAAEKPTRKMREELERATDAVIKADREFKDAKSTLRDTRSVMNDAGIAVADVTRKEKELAGAMGRVGDELDANYKKFKKVAEQQKRWSDAKRQFRDSMTVATGLAATGASSFYTGERILRGVYSPLNEAAGFEEAMQGVRAVTRTFSASTMGEEQKKKNEAGFKALRENAQMLGETTSFSNVEAAQGQYYLGAAGMSPDEIVGSMKSVLDLAKAGRTDLALTSEISAGILRGYGLQAKDMGRVADALVGTFTRAKVSVQDVGETLSYVGPNAQQAGVDLEYLAAATGKLGDSSIKGSRAGTALRAILSRLAGPPKEASDALRELGVSTKDAQGNMRPLAEIFEEMHVAMQKYGNAEQLEFGKKIAGDEGSSALGILLKRRNEILELMEQLKAARGEASEIAGVMADAAKGDEKILESSVSALKTSVGDVLLPTYRELLQKTTAVVGTIREFAEANPEITKAVGTLATAVGGLTVAFGVLAFVAAPVVGIFAMLRLGKNVNALVGAMGQYSEAFDKVGDSAGRAANNTRSLKSSTRGLLGKAGLLNGLMMAYTAYDLVDKMNIKPIEDVTAEDHAALQNKIKAGNDAASKIPVIGDLYRWTSGVRESWFGKTVGPQATHGDMMSLGDKRAELEDLDRRISTVKQGALNPAAGNMLAASLQQERAELVAEIDRLSSGVGQAGLDQALQAQADGVNGSNLPGALNALDAKIRAASAGGGANLPHRAGGGRVRGGYAHEVNEHGQETLVTSLDGRVLSHSDAMRAASGGGAGGGLIVEKIEIVQAPNQDVNSLVDVLLRKLDERYRQQKMTSYQNSGFA